MLQGNFSALLTSGAAFSSTTPRIALPHTQEPDPRRESGGTVSRRSSRALSSAKSRPRRMDCSRTTFWVRNPVSSPTTRKTSRSIGLRGTMTRSMASTHRAQAATSRLRSFPVFSRRTILSDQDCGRELGSHVLAVDHQRVPTRLYTRALEQWYSERSQRACSASPATRRSAFRSVAQSFVGFTGQSISNNASYIGTKCQSASFHRQYFQLLRQPDVAARTAFAHDRWASDPLPAELPQCRQRRIPRNV